MTITVSPALPSDIPYLSTIQWAALLSNPLTQTLYPQGPTPALTRFTRESYQKALQFPSVRLIKATDNEQGEILGFAKWIIYSEEPEISAQSEGEHGENGKEKPASGWGNDELLQKPADVNEKALAAWNNSISKARMKVMKKNGHVCGSNKECTLRCYFGSIAPALWVLDILHTHPSHQGRGVAKMLLKWGSNLAERMHLPCYVESSPAAYPLFKNQDFEDIIDIEIDLKRYRNGYGSYTYKHIAMVRPPNIPPAVPLKDPTVLKANGWDFGFLDRSDSLSNGTSGHVVSGKASLVDIERSPRPGQRHSSRASIRVTSSELDRRPSTKESDLKTSPGLDGYITPRESLSATSPEVDGSHSWRKSDSVSSLTGRFPEPPSKAGSHSNTPPVERVWFSEHHSQAST